MPEIEWSQPSLDLGPRPAVRLLLEVLLDPQEELATISVEARTYPSRELVALISYPQIQFAGVEEAVRLVGQTFTAILREHSGPFA